jgi:hypothetical protein
MLILNLTIHHSWGRVLGKVQESRVIVYTDDGYIKTKLSVTLQVLSEFKSVFKEDSGLDVPYSIITTRSVLTLLREEIVLDSF